MKKFFKLTTIIAATTALTASVGISASASTSSTASYWSVVRQYQANVYKYTDSGTVSNLVNGTDDGVTFVRNTFNYTGNSAPKAKCDIEHDIKLYPNEYAFITSSQPQSTCLFVSNWYYQTGSSVSYTITATNYANAGNFGIYGYAH